MGRGINTLTSAEVDIEVSAKSIKGHDFAKDEVYDPDISVSNYFHPICGDMVFGKFNRIAVYKTNSIAIRSRIIIQLGPKNERGER